MNADAGDAPDGVGFRLTDSDRSALELLRDDERNVRGCTVLVVLVMLAIPVTVMTVDPEETMAWWQWVLLGPMYLVFGVVIAFDGLFSRTGTIPKVLAGAPPVAVVTGTMVDAGGDEPLSWSFELDVPVVLDRFVYFGDEEPEWLLCEGLRCRMYLFRTRSQLAGIVCVEDMTTRRRYWKFNGSSGTDPRYVAPSDM